MGEDDYSAALGASFRGSELELEGLDSPKSRLHIWKGLDAGDSCLEAKLARVPGQRLTTRSACCVMGAGLNLCGIPGRACLGPLTVDGWAQGSLAEHGQRASQLDEWLPL
ncbi:MAG: hypothetical protein QF681_19390 [Vicinamibacterales bacterium]|jgi:hypothetical protein|nr:hypothetical protein [Vicinamibacterales bacterium]